MVSKKVTIESTINRIKYCFLPECLYLRNNMAYVVLSIVYQYPTDSKILPTENSRI